MSKEISNSLIKGINLNRHFLGDMSKPATVLIEKISNAVGGLFEPGQIKRIAKAKAVAEITKAEAEAKVAMIKAESDIKITDLNRRAARRWIKEESQHQKNMEEITIKSLSHLKESAKPELMENDWITNFFGKSRMVSDSEMQDLWALILAGEANAPGTYSKRTVNCVSELDKADAELFSNLCNFGWIIGANFMPLVFDVQAEIYNKYGINFAALSDLESIGLIRFDGFAGFKLTEIPKSLSYFGEPLHLNMSRNFDNKLPVGVVLLTRIGRELAPICKRESVDGFYEYVKKWQGWNLPLAVS